MKHLQKETITIAADESRAHPRAWRQLEKLGLVEHITDFSVISSPNSYSLTNAGRALVELVRHLVESEGWSAG